MRMDMANQSVLVIGGSSGIGLAVAQLAAELGGKVTIASRDQRNLSKASDAIGTAVKIRPVRQLSLEDAYASMNSKFWGAYRIARAAKINDNGSLTLVSGFLSQRPSASSVLQGAINAALEGLMRGLAIEFAPIRVNAVSPGLIDTPLYSKLGEEQRRKLYDSTKDRLPVRRIGDAKDVAKAVLFVATNPFVTGSVVTIDGGGTIA